MARSSSLRQEEVVGITDVGQEQRTARDGIASRAAVFLFDDVAEPVDAEHTAPYVEQGAYDGTDHVAKEAVGRDGELPLRGSDLFPPRMSDVAVVRLYVRVEFRERSEVCVVEQRLCSLVHLFKIQWQRITVGVWLEW